MIHRIYDAVLISEVIEYLLKGGDRPDPIEWLSNPKHIVLINQDNDIAIFEPGIKHVYSGHYYFKSRGRAAINAGKAFLDYILPELKVIIGFVPIEYKASRWITRQIGFDSFGFGTINNKEYEMFIITRTHLNE